MLGWIERRRRKRERSWSRYMCLNGLNGERYRTDQYNYGSRRFNWPYCLQRLENGHWVVLNRDYKPLNMYTEQWLDSSVYQQYGKELPRLTEKVAEELHGGQNKYKKNGGAIHLYFDGNMPEQSLKCRRAYERRLELLSWVLGDDDRLWRYMFWTDERIYPPAKAISA